ncbi:MAG TPA: hypothetical protein VH724_04005, partial [Candidatus Angelobacter sp.]|nr:hypothetical protein [Candidatus Angelobacter sp.]
PQSDPRLAEALRRMAASSRQGAPAELGAGLVTAFRRHHIRRKRVRMAVAAGLAACVVLLVSLVFMRPAEHTPSTEQVRKDVPSVPAKAPDVVVPVSPATTAAVAPRAAGKHLRPKFTAASASAAAGRQFLALPGYDPAVPADELHVVRVRLPASALWQMGAPMSPDGESRRVLADFVVSQDGTPYAVRLVQ